MVRGLYTFCYIFKGSWFQAEAVQSSTWRKLVALYRVYIHLLANQHVKWFTDNKGVASIVARGSMKHDLQSKAKHMFIVCFRNFIRLNY